MLSALFLSPFLAYFLFYFCYFVNLDLARLLLI